MEHNNEIPNQPALITPLEKLSFCMSTECHKYTTTENIELIRGVTSKGIRHRLAGECSECGKNKSTFVTKEYYETYKIKFSK